MALLGAGSNAECEWMAGGAAVAAGVAVVALGVLVVGGWKDWSRRTGSTAASSAIHDGDGDTPLWIMSCALTATGNLALFADLLGAKSRAPTRRCASA